MPGIATLTLNPALDKNVRVEHVEPNAKLRCRDPGFEPGGGGINVARAVHSLGGEADAVWTCGGAIGRMLGRLLDGRVSAHHPVEIDGMTRENVSVVEKSSGNQFRFCMPGPDPGESAIRACIEKLRELDPEYLVASGSLPGKSDENSYTRITEGVGSGCRVVIDTSGPALKKSLGAGVFLIKPNIRELGQLVGRSIEGDDDIEKESRSLIDAGKAEVVLTSLGSGGAMLVTAYGAEAIRAPTVEIRSKIGAGDSTVAGLVLALARGEPITRAARFGVAAGSAAVMRKGPGLCDREVTEKLFGKINDKPD